MTATTGIMIHISVIVTTSHGCYASWAQLSVLFGTH